MLHTLDGTWSIQLPDDGSGDPDDEGNLVVECELGTIVVAVFEAEQGFDPEASLDELKAADRPAPRAEFDEYGPDGTLRWAFLVDEDDEDHAAALYGYVIGAAGWVQVAVLYADPHDHDRALGVWRSVRLGPAA
jgi:hypothetical protein